MWWLRRALCLSVFLLCACAGEGEGLPEVWQRRDALAIPGPWQIPPSTLGAGDRQYVAYEGAGSWVGEAGCAGSLLSGTRLVGDYLAAQYSQISMVGGYSCRAIRGTAETMSLHGVGRALDLHIPTLGNPAQADNELGDQIGEFLIAHAELLGIQLIIWDEWSWGASRATGNKGRIYTGVNPHHDHLHVELSAEAAFRDKDWFSAVLAEELADAGMDAGIDPGDAGMTPDPDRDAATAGDPDASEPEEEDPAPGLPKPVIEPILDDDPLRELPTDIHPVNTDNTIYGSSCSAHSAQSSEGALPLAWLLGVLFVRKGRRSRAGQGS